MPGPPSPAAAPGRPPRPAPADHLQSDDGGAGPGVARHEFYGPLGERRGGGAGPGVDGTLCRVFFLYGNAHFLHLLAFDEFRSTWHTMPVLYIYMTYQPRGIRGVGHGAQRCNIETIASAVVSVFFWDGGFLRIRTAAPEWGCADRIICIFCIIQNDFA